MDKYPKNLTGVLVMHQYACIPIDWYCSFPTLADTENFTFKSADKSYN